MVLVSLHPGKKKEVFFSLKIYYKTMGKWNRALLLSVVVNGSLKYIKRIFRVFVITLPVALAPMIKGG